MMLNLVHQSFGRYALGKDETIIPSLKAVLACGLILGTVIPSLRGFIAWFCSPLGFRVTIHLYQVLQQLTRTRGLPNTAARPATP